MPLALQIGAGRGFWACSLFDLTVLSGEVHGTAAAVLVWPGWVFDAGSSVLACERTPLVILTVWPTEAWLALAVQAAGLGLDTSPIILAS